MAKVLPPSLAIRPNLAWNEQTIKQLEAERDYWIEKVKSAPGFASANQADKYRKACEQWIARRQQEKN